MKRVWFIGIAMAWMGVGHPCPAHAQVRDDAAAAQPGGPTERAGGAPADAAASAPASAPGDTVASAPASAPGDAAAGQGTAPDANAAAATLAQENRDLRQELARLREETARLQEQSELLQEESALLREDMGYLERQVRDLLPVRGRLSGYLDMGLFYVTGTGAGHRADTGNLVFPEYEDVSASWVFLGDPLSTAVNARGEPASTGDSRGVAFDPIGARSAFLVNALNMQLYAAAGERLTLTGVVDFVPRGRDASDPGGLFLGDFVDVKLAYVQYRAPVERFGLDLYAGKMDSVLGYEYRIQESPDRFAVTPSLLCRYICGRPVGLKARARFLGDALIANLAVANGSSFVEHFGFFDESDSNRFKTVSGRLSYRLPLGQEAELGVSGAFGAQDGQAGDDVYQRHLGMDLHVVVGDVDLALEYMRGEAPGLTDSPPDDAPPDGEGMMGPGAVACDLAPCIDYDGLYARVAYRATNAIIPYARVDWRDAMHRSGRSFVYVAELIRATLGLRLDVGSHVIVKAEYTLNRELGRLPQIPNDVLTSSLVVRY